MSASCTAADRVIVGDVADADAGETQHQADDDSGAILARMTVHENRRSGGVRDRIHRGRDACPAFAEPPAVDLRGGCQMVGIVLVIGEDGCVERVHPGIDQWARSLLAF